MYKVYDKVYILENNEICQKLVYAVVEEMNFLKNGTNVFYKLVNGTIGACDDKAIQRQENEMFTSKEEVAEYLINKS